MTSRNRTFARQEIFPSYIFNRLQDRLGPLTNLRLRRVNATTIEAVADTGDDAAVISIEGRWRFVEAPVQRAAPGGAAGVFAIFAVATDNDVVASPEANTDETVYDFDLRIVADGSTPALLAGEVEIFGRIGRLTWDGAAITDVRQEVGVVGGPQLADDVLDRLFVSGALDDRPDASAVNAGLVFADEFGTHWRSDGASWLLAGGKVPYCLCTVASSSVASGLGGDLLTLLDERDDWGMHGSGTTDIALPYAGVWEISAKAALVPFNGGNRLLSIDAPGFTNANGDVLGFIDHDIRPSWASSSWTNPAHAKHVLRAGAPVRVSAGQVIQLRVAQDSGSALNVQPGIDDTFLAARMISS